MDEKNAKLLFFILLLLSLFLSIYPIWNRPTKSVVCNYQDNEVYCINLGLITRNCTIYFKNYIANYTFFPLAKIEIKNESNLVSWSCQ